MRIGILSLALLLLAAPASLGALSPCCEPTEAWDRGDPPACPTAPNGACLGASDDGVSATRASGPEPVASVASRPTRFSEFPTISVRADRALEAHPPRPPRFLLYESFRN